MPIGLGTVSTAGVAELIARTYDPVFSSLRDTDVSIKKLLFPETKEGNDKIRWHLDANDKNKVRTVGETDLNRVITEYNAATNPTGPLDTTTGSGALAAAAAFMTPNLHPVIEAELDIRHMVQTIMIGAKQLAAIKGGKDSFQNILTREVEQSLKDWAREIEDMILTFNDAFRTGAEAAGNGGKDLDNLGTMLAIGSPNPGIYNVRYDTYPEFKPYVNHAAGVARPLTIALLQDVMNKLEGGNDTFRRNARVDMILAGPAQFTNYGNLLTAQRRYTATEKLDGGFMALEFNGRKLVAVPGFTANKLLFADKQTPQGEHSFEYRVLKNYSCEDRSVNTIGALLYVCVHMANTLCKGRRYQGILTDLS
jgi:hypothetical protein